MDVRKDMNVTGQQERFEVIAAFADGERVDTNALRAALADEAGRDYLIDLIAMREMVGETMDGRSGGVAGPGAMSTAVESGAAMGTHARATTHRARFMTGLAAALVLAVGLAGYAIGHQHAEVVPVAVLPPLEADVVVAVEAPPPPTQVIRLGSGVSSEGGR
jgi:hypothetical protein